ncbi:hypothetical protein ABT354_10095 [Streptomyces sp. NPDC000594]|uniref:hypothetical protein n=1 Tax=Streptomyces sp. NPDC000594 TaxID=3154261 RepID=UPI00332CB2C5
MPIDPFTALNALIRAEVARSARPADEPPPVEDRDRPPADPAPPPLGEPTPGP